MMNAELMKELERQAEILSDKRSPAWMDGYRRCIRDVARLSEEEVGE